MSSVIAEKVLNIFYYFYDTDTLTVYGVWLYQSVIDDDTWYSWEDINKAINVLFDACLIVDTSKNRKHSLYKLSDRGVKAWEYLNSKNDSEKSEVINDANS